VSVNRWPATAARARQTRAACRATSGKGGGVASASCHQQRQRRSDRFSVLRFDGNVDTKGPRFSIWCPTTAPTPVKQGASDSELSHPALDMVGYDAVGSGL
jgi:hypothetical protein